MVINTGRHSFVGRRNELTCDSRDEPYFESSRAVFTIQDDKTQSMRESEERPSSAERLSRSARLGTGVGPAIEFNDARKSTLFSFFDISPLTRDNLQFGERHAAKQ
jgi:hypothetical protein